MTLAVYRLDLDFLFGSSVALVALVLTAVALDVCLRDVFFFGGLCVLACLEAQACRSALILEMHDGRGRDLGSTSCLHTAPPPIQSSTASVPSIALATTVISSLAPTSRREFDHTQTVRVPEIVTRRPVNHGPRLGPSCSSTRLIPASYLGS